MDGGTIFTLIFVVFIVVCFFKAVNTVSINRPCVVAC